MNKPTHPTLEPTCPDCGNNAQVWTNQISGEKVCHRSGCHKTISQAPHPLALKASEAIRQSPHRGLTGVAITIHTTALELVLKEAQVTEKLLKEWLEFSKDVMPGCAAGADWLMTLRNQTQRLSEYYSTLTNLKTAPQSHLAGSRSDLEPLDGSK